MKHRITFILVFISVSIYGQNLTGEALLDKAINYHDPTAFWPQFNGTLNVTMETPKNANRDSEIAINLPEDYFYIKATRNSNTTEYTLKKDSCSIAFNGFTNISQTDIKTHGLTCERATMYKNYYTPSLLALP